MSYLAEYLVLASSVDSFSFEIFVGILLLLLLLLLVLFLLLLSSLVIFKTILNSLLKPYREISHYTCHKCLEKFLSTALKELRRKEPIYKAHMQTISMQIT